jgi:hypothetical protein
MILVHPLRVPLHRDQKGMAGVLDALHETILGAFGREAKSGGEVLDELVVGAGHHGLGHAHDGVEACPRQDADGMDGLPPVLSHSRVVRQCSRPAGQILVERPAGRDVEHLESATDPQDRRPPLQG